MSQPALISCLESPEHAEPLLRSWNLTRLESGWQNLKHLADRIGLEALKELAGPFARLLPRCPDPDMALINFERFLANAEGARKLPALLEGKARGLEICLQLLSTSQFFSDLLYANPDDLDMLRVPLRRSPSPEELRQQLQAEVDATEQDSAILTAFRRYRQRQILRIGTNDIIRDRPLEEITRDISHVADVALEVALRTALRQLTQRFGDPYTDAGQPARCVALAFGKLGGEELNYSSDIDLMFLYDEEGLTRGRRGAGMANAEFFARVVSEVVRLLSAHTDRGQAYRTDLRLRPEGMRAPLTRSLASTLDYYDKLGRTWERQALIKVRPVAGDLRLGEEFIRAIESFVYRRYLSSAEINEIKAIKRRIEHKASQAGVSETEVKTGHGGIRDIEFTIQFLQLLNGGDLTDLRTGNTLEAIVQLEKCGCLTHQERTLLEDNYSFLRKVEHRLQIMFDLQTHLLPSDPAERRKLARRLGHSDFEQASALDAFDAAYKQTTEVNRKILDHLLHDAFSDDAQTEPESDLVLDPEPSPQRIEQVLGKYRFLDVQAAYRNLMDLGNEKIRFLSTRRCRHFLAAIAPRLLKAISATPSPDFTLVNLCKVSDSVGGKGVLWELFSFNPPTLRLYVELCSSSQYLSAILTSNPGMLDELLDGLLLDKLPTLRQLSATLT